MADKFSPWLVQCSDHGPAVIIAVSASKAADAVGSYGFTVVQVQQINACIELDLADENPVIDSSHVVGSEDQDK